MDRSGFSPSFGPSWADTSTANNNAATPNKANADSTNRELRFISRSLFGLRDDGPRPLQRVASRMQGPRTICQRGIDYIIYIYLADASI